MKRLALSCYALSICAAPILLSGCGGSQTAIGVPGAQNAPMTNAVDRGSSYMKPTAAQKLPVLPDSFHRTSASENLVYSFRSTPDGNDPFAGLINVKGELYGTTSEVANIMGAPFSVSTFPARRKLSITSAGVATEKIPRPASSKLTAPSMVRPATAASMDMEPSLR